MDLFALRRPCPIKCDSLFNRDQRKAKKNNTLRSLPAPPALPAP